MLRTRLNFKDESGFTLIELMVGVLIVAVLVGVAVPVYGNFRADAWDRAAQANVRQALVLQKAYAEENGAFTAFVWGTTALGQQGETRLRSFDASFKSWGIGPAASNAYAYPGGSINWVDRESTATCITAFSESGTWFTVYQERGDQPFFGTGIPACNAGLKTTFSSGSW